MNPNAKAVLWILQHPLIHVIFFLGIFLHNAINREFLAQELWSVFIQTIPVACAFFIMSALASIFSRPDQIVTKPQIQYPGRDKTDIEQVSVHEAGHLIGMALFPQPPNDISIKIDLKKPLENLNGYVRYTWKVKTMDDMRACIKMLLASSCAEQLLLNKTLCGNDHDLQQVEYVARKYLQFFAGINESVTYLWFRNVESEVEAKINAQTINDLIRDFQAETLVFVKRNESLLLEIKNHIMLHPNREHQNDWCQEVLRKVVVS